MRFSPGCCCDDEGGGGPGGDGPDCPPCCEPASAQYTATLPSGFTNGADCSACAELSGASFLLTQTTGCRWEYTEPDFCPSCQEETFDLSIAFSLTESGGKCVATLRLELHGPEDSDCRGDVVTWQRIYTAPAAFDCDGANALPIATVSPDGPACATHGTGDASVAPA